MVACCLVPRTRVEAEEHLHKRLRRCVFLFCRLGGWDWGFSCSCMPKLGRPLKQ